jgi:hypothetical protein
MAKIYRKKCSKTLAIKEMQIKTMLRFCLIPVRMVATKNTNNKNVGEDVGKKELSYTVGGNVNECSHYEKQYGGSSKN